MRRPEGMSTLFTEVEDKIKTGGREEQKEIKKQ
jgi:hypothetical protein